MFGQQELLQKLKCMAEANKFPRFLLLVGQAGSEQSEVISELTRVCEGATLEMWGSKVDDIRCMIEMAYKNIKGKYLYVIEDVDSISLAGKNALLKVTEEPPNNAYFVMFAENVDSILDTIKSRATVIQMDGYSDAQLLKYAEQKYHETDKEYAHICNTPGDVDLLHSFGVENVMEYVRKVIYNIHVVSGSNSFKIGGMLNLGNKSEDKIDLRLFWNCFNYKCHVLLSENPDQYTMGIIITCKYLKQLQVSGVNKQMLFDNWVLEMRSEWMQYADD